MEVPVLDVSTDHEEVEEARHHVDGCRGGEYDGPGLEGVVVLGDGADRDGSEVGCEAARQRVGHPEYCARQVGSQVSRAGEVAGGESSVEEHPGGDEAHGEGHTALTA